MSSETLQVDADSFIAYGNRKNEVRGKLIESIEEVLNFSMVVLNFLELNTPFKKNEILDSPEIFSIELEDLFGASARGIENLIIERFYSKIKIKYVRDRDKTFSDYVMKALESYIDY
ncbi:MAG: hypothetical protein NWE89_07115 [Candidatus Bathyarchaeota archaeon]|nr:hypothetical protein [Candidatus Bathyarchaeota archaeon]